MTSNEPLEQSYYSRFIIDTSYSKSYIYVPKYEMFFQALENGNKSSLLKNTTFKSQTSQIAGRTVVL